MGGAPPSWSVKLCWCVRVIGNVHTVVSVYWCVVGGEYELGVYADGRSYSCVG